MSSLDDLWTQISNDVAKSVGDTIGDATKNLTQQVTDAGQNITNIISGVQQSQNDVTQLANFSDWFKKWGTVAAAGLIGLAVVIYFAFAKRR